MNQRKNLPALLKPPGESTPISSQKSSVEKDISQVKKDIKALSVDSKSLLKETKESGKTLKRIETAIVKSVNPIPTGIPTQQPIEEKLQNLVQVISKNVSVKEPSRKEEPQKEDSFLSSVSMGALGGALPAVGAVGLKVVSNAFSANARPGLSQILDEEDRKTREARSMGPPRELYDQRVAEINQQKDVEAAKVTLEKAKIPPTTESIEAQAARESIQRRRRQSAAEKIIGVETPQQIIPPIEQQIPPAEGNVESSYTGVTPQDRQDAKKRGLRGESGAQAATTARIARRQVQVQDALSEVNNAPVPEQPQQLEPATPQVTPVPEQPQRQPETPQVTPVPEQPQRQPETPQVTPVPEQPQQLEPATPQVTPVPEQPQRQPETGPVSGTERAIMQMQGLDPDNEFDRKLYRRRSAVQQGVSQPAPALKVEEGKGPPPKVIMPTGAMRVPIAADAEPGAAERGAQIAADTARFNAARERVTGVKPMQQNAARERVTGVKPMQQDIIEPKPSPVQTIPAYAPPAKAKEETGPVSGTERAIMQMEGLDPDNEFDRKLYRRRSQVQSQIKPSEPSETKGGEIARISAENTDLKSQTGGAQIQPVVINNNNSTATQTNVPVPAQPRVESSFSRYGQSRASYW